MTGAVWLEIVLIAALIALNGFFAGAEAALIAVRRSRVNELAVQKGAAGRTLQRLKNAPDRFLATVQVGVTVVGTLASVISGATVVGVLAPHLARLPWDFARRWADQIAISIVVVIIAIATLVFGELVPKYLALARPDAVALRVAGPIAWLARLGHPVVVALSAIARGITRLLGVRPPGQYGPVSDQEIRLLALEGSLHGTIDDIERELIHQALDFSDTTARQVMTPRPDVVGINRDDDVESLLRTIREEGYSRFPVWEKTIDRIVGVVYTKDVIHLLTEGSPIILSDLIRPVLFVPDSMPISKVLLRFKAERRHMAVVLDEFGGTAGLLTLEDIIEEIVGEIQDEHDAEPEAFRLLGDGTALVAGGMAVIDFNERFSSNLPTDRGDTLAGVVTATLDRFPRKGDFVVIDGVRLDVATLEERRIKLLRARRA